MQTNVDAACDWPSATCWSYKLSTVWLPLLGLGVHGKYQGAHEAQLLFAAGLGAGQQKPQGTLRSALAYLCLLAAYLA